MLQTHRLEHLADPVEHAEHDPDAQLATGERHRLAAEQDEHHDRGDAEAHGEEVGGRDVLDEVADEEERRAPDRRDGDEEQRGEPGVPGRSAAPGGVSVTEAGRQTIVSVTVLPLGARPPGRVLQAHGAEEPAQRLPHGDLEARGLQRPARLLHLLPDDVRDVDEDRALGDHQRHRVAPEQRAVARALADHPPLGDRVAVLLLRRVDLEAEVAQLREAVSALLPVKSGTSIGLRPLLTVIATAVPFFRRRPGRAWRRRPAPRGPSRRTPR